MGKVKSSKRKIEKNDEKEKKKKKKTFVIEYDSDTDSATFDYADIEIKNMEDNCEVKSIVKRNPDDEKEVEVMDALRRLASFKLPTKKKLKKEARPLDADILFPRLENTYDALRLFERLPPGGYSRDEYIAQYTWDLNIRYRWSEFVITSLLKMLDYVQTHDHLAAMEDKLRLYIRANTIKIERTKLIDALSSQGIECKPIHKWTNVGLVVLPPIVSGFETVNTEEEYDKMLKAEQKAAEQQEAALLAISKNGCFEIQDLSSLLPVMALDPQKNEEIAHMLANYGEQTSHIAALMGNTGQIYANVQVGSIGKLLEHKLDMMGVTNTEISLFVQTHRFRGKNSVNRVLLSAPCSKTGLISYEMAEQTCEEDVSKNMKILLKLLLGAIDMAKCGGVVVYSTHSMLVEENESIIDAALKRRHVKAVHTGLESGRPGFTSYNGTEFDSQLKFTRRFYPHVNGMSGTFVAKLKKESSSKKMVELKDAVYDKEEAGKETEAEQVYPVLEGVYPLLERWKRANGVSQV